MYIDVHAAYAWRYEFVVLFRYESKIRRRFKTILSIMTRTCIKSDQRTNRELGTAAGTKGKDCV